jgi:hypothetical protein
MCDKRFLGRMIGLFGWLVGFGSCLSIAVHFQRSNENFPELMNIFSGLWAISSTQNGFSIGNLVLVVKISGRKEGKAMTKGMLLRMVNCNICFSSFNWSNFR